jgi:hypothetical protein
MADQEKKCKLLKDIPGLADGIGCCKCSTYNGVQRPVCKNCGHEFCHGKKIIMVSSSGPKDPNQIN